MKLKTIYFLFALDIGQIGNCHGFNVRANKKKSTKKPKKPKKPKNQVNILLWPQDCDNSGDCPDYGECSSSSCESGKCSVTYEQCSTCTSGDLFWKNVKVIVKTDDYPEETEYIIEDVDTGETVMASSPFENERKTFSKRKCFKPGHYKFTIFDYGGDGICCDYGNGNFIFYFHLLAC